MELIIIVSIAGGGVALAVFITVAFVIYCCCCRKKKESYDKRNAYLEDVIVCPQRPQKGKRNEGFVLEIPDSVQPATDVGGRRSRTDESYHKRNAYLENVTVFPQIPQKVFTVSDTFMEKHVASFWEMPAKNRKAFATEKAEDSYPTNGLPTDYSIIVVDDKEDFRCRLEDEADRLAVGQSLFATDEPFHVEQFVLHEWEDRYLWERSGEARLVLGCRGNEIYHLEEPAFLNDL